MPRVIIIDVAEFECECGHTLIQAMAIIGINSPGCKKGCCGTCKTKVVSGSIEMEGDAPGVVSDEEFNVGHCFGLLVQDHGRRWY